MRVIPYETDSDTKETNTTTPSLRDKVRVHYEGTLANGEIFDSSRQRGQPFEFTFGTNQVIKCWDEGLKKVRKGMKVRLECPPTLAYGAQGAGNVIPPDSDIFFDIEMIEITAAAPETWKGPGIDPKKKKRSSYSRLSDLPPIGASAKHMCFNLMTVTSVGIFFVFSFLYMVF